MILYADLRVNEDSLAVTPFVTLPCCGSKNRQDILEWMLAEHGICLFCETPYPTDTVVQLRPVQDVRHCAFTKVSRYVLV